MTSAVQVVALLEEYFNSGDVEEATSTLQVTLSQFVGFMLHQAQRPQGKLPQCQAGPCLSGCTEWHGCVAYACCMLLLPLLSGSPWVGAGVGGARLPSLFCEEDLHPGHG